jgi:hypothetical protein
MNYQEEQKSSTLQSLIANFNREVKSKKGYYVRKKVDTTAVILFDDPNETLPRLAFRDMGGVPFPLT